MSDGEILDAGGKSGEVKKGPASEFQLGLKTWLGGKAVRRGSEAKYKVTERGEEQWAEK